MDSVFSKDLGSALVWTSMLRKIFCPDGGICNSPLFAPCIRISFKLSSIIEIDPFPVDAIGDEMTRDVICVKFPKDCVDIILRCADDEIAGRVVISVVEASVEGVSDGIEGVAEDARVLLPLVPLWEYKLPSKRSILDVHLDCPSRIERSEGVRLRFFLDPLTPVRGEWTFSEVGAVMVSADEDAALRDPGVEARKLWCAVHDLVRFIAWVFFYFRRFDEWNRIYASPHAFRVDVKAEMTVDGYCALEGVFRFALGFFRCAFEV